MVADPRHMAVAFFAPVGVILAEPAQPALFAGRTGGLVTFAVRGLAITYSCSMTAYRRRPGRTLEEIEELRK